MMTFGFYEKTPSLSLRLRVGPGTQERKQTSNKLECHSSLFESHSRFEGDSKLARLEYTRIFSNKLE